MNTENTFPEKNQNNDLTDQLESCASKASFNDKIISLLRRINLKITFSILIGLAGIIAAYYTYKSFQIANKSFERENANKFGIIGLTISKCTFFIPSNCNDELYNQYEMYVINNEQAALNLRIHRSTWFFRDSCDSIVFLTESDKRLFLGFSESKTLTFSSYLYKDDEKEYCDLFNEIETKVLGEVFKSFCIDIVSNYNLQYRACFNIQANTLSWSPENDSLPGTPDRSVQISIIQPPPFVNIITFTDKDFEKTIWEEKGL